MRREIKNLYGSDVGKSYEEDLKRSRSRRSDPEGRRLQRYGESEVKGYQKRAARSYTTKVAKEAAAKAAKAAKLVTRANLATTAAAVAAPYITKGINKIVDKGFKYLSKKNSGSQRKEIK